ncbi:MAG: peptide-binding protein [Candidatus Rokuibacteriota bacterium]|nr:MAG: peptide-binding protein [Candidatus Rokubacteria bacterium]PYN60215.1 MAG: peptide-binding protein [Candidatus Rokubacteria bacterium]
MALAAALALAACGGEADSAVEQGSGRPGEKPAYGDTFIESLTGNISGLIPNVLSDSASFEIGSMLYSGLITRDKDLNIIGELAESWTFSQDCLDLTFNLRRNVRWHDGRPFTAADVVFTYETMIHPKTPTAYREDFKAVAEVAAPDPYTLRVRYKQPYAKALQSWGLWMLPRHLLESYVREGRLREAPQNRSNPVGTGAYRFGEWKPGEKVVLVANPDYFEGRPHLGRVVYRIIPSQATIFLELKAKGVDAAGLTALQFKRQTEYPAFRKAYHKYEYPANAYTYLGFNLKDPRFADRRVRQAIAHAIDKRELIDGVLLGLGREATGPYKPGTWAHNPSVRTYPYDMAKARALLAAAGWTETNADGVLVRNGQPFTFELLTNQGNDERKKVAEIVQASLKELGIQVDIRVIEWASLLKEYIKKRRFEAIILGWGIGLDPDQYEIWHSSKTGPDELNHISYANPEVDALLEQGRTSCRQEERKKSYARFQEVLAEDQPYVFLYFRDALPVVSSRVRGIVPAPSGIRYNFNEWYVPTHLQRYTAG